MKKLLSYVVLTLVSTFVLVGCTPKETEETVTPPAADTNTTPANP